MIFLVMGAVSAAESINGSYTEDSNNIIGDNDDSLSANNKLEISNEDSISETNIVNSHDDNLGGYPDDEVLNSIDLYYEGNDQKQSFIDLGADGENTLCATDSSSDSVIADISSSDIVGADSSAQSGIIAASPVSTKINVVDTHYTKSSTYFDVTLTDVNGKAIANQKVSLVINKKTFSAITDSKGKAVIKTNCLAVGTYTVSLSYGGNENYSSSSASKKVKVLSSVVGKDLTKYCGDTSKYKVTLWNGNSVLKNTKVTFKYDGKSYTGKTNNKGQVSLNKFLAAGKYTVSVTNPVTGEKVSHNIVVKKDQSKFEAKSKIYVHPNKKGSLTVVLKTKHDVELKNKKITFTYNGKKVTNRTNVNGKATLTIPVLAKGTYNVNFKYGGNDDFYSTSGSAKVVVAEPTTKLSSQIVVQYYGESSKFKVKLTNSTGHALANKNVKIKLDGKTTVCKTNKNGVAQISLKNINPGTYSAKYSFSTKGLKDYSYGSKNVIILKLVGVITAKDLTMKVNDDSNYQVTVKDKSGKVLKNVKVKSTIGNKNYYYITDSNGKAKFEVTQTTGKYNIKTILADPYYKSAPVTKQIIIKGTKFVASNTNVPEGAKATYSVKVVNENNKVVKNRNVKFTINGKEYGDKSDSNGIAKVSLGVLPKGNHVIKFNDGSAYGSAKITVMSKVTVKNLVAASKSVNSYISKHSKLPSSVKIGGVSFKTADYLYLVSKAIVNLKNGKKSDIPIKVIKNPSSPKKATSLGYLKDYLSVAQKIVKTAESKGKMPNSVSSKVGAIGYDGVVAILAKVMVSYGKNNKMPSSYIHVTAFSDSSSTKAGGINMKNTISNLAAYLAASTNCQVNDAKIKKLVSKLIKDCKTEKEKATKLFNYVRDTISYSFYYNTRFGAVGTLNAGTGNCVDHAHLVVAMCRAAGLATRYVHATCHFSSGNTYGHVFAQVLIGNTWTVADATSSRNSLGNVANWNTNSYSLHAITSSISF